MKVKLSHRKISIFDVCLTAINAKKIFWKEKIIIPYRRLSDKARKPKLSNVIDGKFIYNLQSAENGIEILRNVNFISTHLVISIPRNINCHVKSFFYENDGTVIYDYNLINGLFFLFFFLD